MNGDGFDDVFISAAHAYTGSAATNYAHGQGYVIFGSSSFSTPFDLSTLNGSNGFAFEGEGKYQHMGFHTDHAGDVNGDGYDDVIIGAPYPHHFGYYGDAYVVFGGASFSGLFNVSTLTGGNGFQIPGIVNGLDFGYSTSGVGDVNGDGFDDILITMPGKYGDDYPGDAYVVFGKTTFTANFNLATLDGTTGFKFSGALNDEMGRSASGIGDFNGDGFDDFIVGAYRNDYNGDDAGAAYVVFGASSFTSTLSESALTGSNGFQILGISAGDWAGYNVAARVGDVNGDGYDDIVVSAPKADDEGIDFGAAYLIFGAAGGWSATFTLSSVNGTNGILLTGSSLYNNVGYDVRAAGDVNGDGFDDIVGGSRYAGSGDGGETVIIFGQDFRISPSSSTRSAARMRMS